MKKHFLKCHGIVDVCEKPDSQGSKHRSCRAVESLAASPRRTRVRSTATRKVTSHAGRSPKLVAKQPLRRRSKRVCVLVSTLLSLAQQAAVIGITRSRRNVARSCVISARRGGHLISFDFRMFCC